MTTPKQLADAAEKYLGAKGYKEILERKTAKPNEPLYLTWYDQNEDCIVVCFIDESYGESKDKITREEAENILVKVIMETPDDYIDKRIRFDRISLRILDASRAILRHHINFLGGGDE